jgi:hypothetical protein
MGLFNINMPPLYGEGLNAFLRLQLEILSKTDDESIFAWDLENRFARWLLAPSPEYFQRSGNVRKYTFDPERPPHSMTSKGLCLSLVLIPTNQCGEESTEFAAPLNCTLDHNQGECLALSLIRRDQGGYERAGLAFHDFSWKKTQIDKSERTLIYVKQDHHDISAMSTLPLVVSFNIGPMLDLGFSVLQKHLLSNNRSADAIGWEEDFSTRTIVLKNCYAHNTAVLVFHCGGADVLAVVLGNSVGCHPWVDTIISTTNQSIPEAVEHLGRKWHRDVGPDRKSVYLSNGIAVSISLRRGMVSSVLSYMVNFNVMSG